MITLNNDKFYHRLFQRFNNSIVFNCINSRLLYKFDTTLITDQQMTHVHIKKCYTVEKDQHIVASTKKQQ